MSGKSIPLTDKLNLIEDAFTRIFADLREVDGSPLDAESAAYLSEAYAIAEVFYELMSSNCTWREAKADFERILYGDVE